MTGRILGTGAYVPARTVENQELAKVVDTNDAWIQERTGIARRHLIEEETTSYSPGSQGGAFAGGDCR